jgi:hypothetical protein
MVGSSTTCAGRGRTPPEPTVSSSIPPSCCGDWQRPCRPRIATWWRFRFSLALASTIARAPGQAGGRGCGDSIAARARFPEPTRPRPCANIHAISTAAAGRLHPPPPVVAVGATAQACLLPRCLDLSSMCGLDAAPRPHLRALGACARSSYTSVSPPTCRPRRLPSSTPTSRSSTTRPRAPSRLDRPPETTVALALGAVQTHPTRSRTDSQPVALRVLGPGVCLALARVASPSSLRASGRGPSPGFDVRLCRR